MRLLDIYWGDFLALVLALVLLNGAVTGRFYTHGRGGGPKLIGKFRSAGPRIIFFLLAVSICVWLVFDIRTKVP
jgi:hypothetical protein